MPAGVQAAADHVHHRQRQLRLGAPRGEVAPQGTPRRPRRPRARPARRRARVRAEPRLLGRPVQLHQQAVDRLLVERVHRRQRRARPRPRPPRRPQHAAAVVAVGVAVTQLHRLVAAGRHAGRHARAAGAAALEADRHLDGRAPARVEHLARATRRDPGGAAHDHLAVRAAALHLAEHRSSRSGRAVISRAGVSRRAPSSASSVMYSTGDLPSIRASINTPSSRDDSSVSSTPRRDRGTTTTRTRARSRQVRRPLAEPHRLQQRWFRQNATSKPGSPQCATSKSSARIRSGTRTVLRAKSPSVSVRRVASSRSTSAWISSGELGMAVGRRAVVRIDPALHQHVWEANASERRRRRPRQRVDPAEQVAGQLGRADLDVAGEQRVLPQPPPGGAQLSPARSVSGSKYRTRGTSPGRSSRPS